MDTATATVNTAELEAKVKEMYQRVALDPFGDFHFEMGRDMAIRLGYAPADLDRIPSEAVDSFAGVGFHFDLAGIQPGERVLDLGSGSGMDSFVAALKTGAGGRVAGADMTDAQREKADGLRRRAEFKQISYHKCYIENLPFEAASFDVVISNGVINLSADKARVFRDAARVLAPGGRLAISDIISEQSLPEGVTCNATLWAACIGGALQKDDYLGHIANAGFDIRTVRENREYRFLTEQAQKACAKFGVKSVSILAVKR